MNATKRTEAMREKGTIGIRLAPETRRDFERLTDMLSDELGVKVTMSQAFAIAVREMLNRRGVVRGAVA